MTETMTAPATGFADLELSDTMRASLEAAGYEQPTPIQAGLIPRALLGIDVLGQARTGTGKTAAFAIPILERLRPHSEVHGTQALVLVPTRELAVQVREEIAKLPTVARHTLSPSTAASRSAGRSKSSSGSPKSSSARPGA